MDHPLEIATTGDKIRPRRANGKIFGLSGSGGALTARAAFIVTAQSVFDRVVHMLPTGQAGASV